MSKNLFITGTGTDVGKTYITGLILKKFSQYDIKAAYYKAAMSGKPKLNDKTVLPSDAVYVKNISRIKQPLQEMYSYAYEYPASPHLASKLEKKPVKMNRIINDFHNVSKKYDYVTIEGSGGIICPLSFDEEDIQLKDIIKTLNLSCLIISNAELGCINNIGLTSSYMNLHKIPIKGIILNNFQHGNFIHEDNKKCVNIYQALGL